MDVARLEMALPDSSVASSNLRGTSWLLKLSIAVPALLISLYVPHALNLSVFPTLLLVTTMFRLALIRLAESGTAAFGWSNSAQRYY